MENEADTLGSKAVFEQALDEHVLVVEEEHGEEDGGQLPL